MQFYAIPCIIANVTKKHVSEDDILFTKPLAGKGLKCLCAKVHQVFCCILHKETFIIDSQYHEVQVSM